DPVAAFGLAGRVVDSYAGGPVLAGRAVDGHAGCPVLVDRATSPGAVRIVDRAHQQRVAYARRARERGEGEAIQGGMQGLHDKGSTPPPGPGPRCVSQGAAGTTAAGASPTRPGARGASPVSPPPHAERSSRRRRSTVSIPSGNNRRWRSSASRA